MQTLFDYEFSRSRVSVALRRGLPQFFSFYIWGRSCAVMGLTAAVWQGAKVKPCQIDRSRELQSRHPWRAIGARSLTPLVIGPGSW